MRDFLLVLRKGCSYYEVVQIYLIIVSVVS